MDNYNDDDLVTVEVACLVYGGRHSPISKATLYRKIGRGEAPKPIHPTPGISRFRYGSLKAGVAQAEAVSMAAKPSKLETT